MRPTKELIAALNAVATKIENKTVAFNWAQPGMCNCGLLAKELLGDDLANKRMGCPLWTDNASSRLAAERCDATGLPLDVVFRELYKHGLETVDDYKEIEFHGQAEQLKSSTEWYRLANSLGRPHQGRFANPDEAVKYFRGLAAKLQVQMDAEVNVKVSVPIKLDVTKFGVHAVHGQEQQQIQIKA